MLDSAIIMASGRWFIDEHLRLGDHRDKIGTAMLSCVHLRHVLNSGVYSGTKYPCGFQFGWFITWFIPLHTSLSSITSIFRVALTLSCSLVGGSLCFGRYWWYWRWCPKHWRLSTNTHHWGAAWHTLCILDASLNWAVFKAPVGWWL